MPHSVCPWWIGWLMASPLRRLFDSPAKLLDGHVREGMTVLEPGPGMGFFTLELARKVGASGKVIAVDIQPRMLDGLRRRAARAGLLDRVNLRLAAPDSLGLADLAGKVDFTLAHAMVHEMPSAASFFAQVARASRKGAHILFAEPKRHVSDADFAAELQAAREAGFRVVEPNGRHTALLEKTS